MRIVTSKIRINEDFWEAWNGTRLGKISTWCQRYTAVIWSAIARLGVSALFYFGWAIIIAIDVCINRHRIHGTDW